MLSVIDLKSIRYERTYPYTRNRQGRMIQEPYFTLNDGGETFHLHGRLVMWSFLDSLYPKQPLPRGPVEDDIFAPDITTPSMLALFQDFANEAVNYNRYLILEHDKKNTVSLVRNLDQYALSSEIEKVGRMLENSGFGVEYRPSVYIDSKGSHLRASLFSRIGTHTLRVIDIGSSYYMSISALDTSGKKYCVMPPLTCKKTSLSIQSKLRDMMDVASVGVSKEQLWQMGKTPEVNESPYLMTRELDTLLHDRLRRCI
jgi:hypothetical protein